MSNRFTERAERVILIAEEEAKRLNHDYVGTEHVLLGLIALAEGVAAQVLHDLGVDLRKIRQEIEHIVGSGDHAMLLGNIPFTPRAKKVLEFAVEEAQNLGQNYVGTEYLLLGLIREEDGIAAQVLESLGVRLDIVREEIHTLTKGPVSAVSDVSPKFISLASSEDPWYTMADKEEVYYALNSLAMTVEPYHNVKEAEYGDTIRQYDYDGNTFYKAEQLWAEREGLV